MDVDKAKLVQRPPTPPEGFSLEVKSCKPKHQKRTAGQWRAWIRMHCLLQPGKPNFTALAHSYHEAAASNTEAFQVCTRMSKASKWAIGALKGGGMFGARGRDCKRMAVKMTRYALWVRCKRKSRLGQAEHLAELSLARMSVGEAISAAKKQERMDGAAKKKQMADDEQFLAHWQDTCGAQQLQVLREVLPEFPWGGLHVLPLPSKHGQIYGLHAQANNAATQGLAWASKTQSSQLPGMLEREWQEMHEAIQPANAKLETQKNTARPCNRAGVCLCDESGDKLYRFRNKVLKEMKSTFHSRDAKIALVSGVIVVRLVIEELCNHCAACSPLQQKMERFLHIAHLSLNPYVPTYHELERQCLGEALAMAPPFIDLKAVQGKNFLVDS
eukprot:6491100-Amphidinium_carterae.2